MIDNSQIDDSSINGSPKSSKKNSLINNSNCFHENKNNIVNNENNLNNFKHNENTGIDDNSLQSISSFKRN